MGAQLWACGREIHVVRQEGTGSWTLVLLTAKASPRHVAGLGSSYCPVAPARATLLGTLRGMTKVTEGCDLRAFPLLRRACLPILEGSHGQQSELIPPGLVPVGPPPSVVSAILCGSWPGQHHTGLCLHLLAACPCLHVLSSVRKDTATLNPGWSHLQVSDQRSPKTPFPEEAVLCVAWFLVDAPSSALT